MTDAKNTNQTETTAAPEAASDATLARPASHSGERERSRVSGAERTIRGRRGDERRERRGRRDERPRSEFEQVTVAVRRVARVMAGGRRFNFSVAIVIGDKKGRVGVGLGKAADTALAIEKATRDARKNLISVSRTKAHSIPHDVREKYASSIVELMPSSGRGVVAGSAVRTVLELAGVTDVVSKIHTRSKNKLTIARATVKALASLRARS